MFRKFRFLWIAIFLAFGLTGCARTVLKPEQTHRSGFEHLSAEETLGQTFTAHYDGLSGIQIYLGPESAGLATITLHLKSDPTSKSDLRVSSLELADIEENQYYLLSFEPINGSNQTDFYLELDLQGNGAANLGISQAESYYFGALYRKGEAQESQLNFSLAYDFKHMLLGLVGEVGKWLLLLFAGALLFVLPGGALLSLFWEGWNPSDWITRLGLSAGLSIALIPVMFLWTSLIGVHLGALYAWLPVLVSLAALLVQILKGKKFQNNKPKNVVKHVSDLWGKFRADPLYLSCLLFAIGSVVFSRVWVLRSLDLPLWGDSYQHTLIAQLLIDNKGLFNSWQPYADLITFTYHFGFHSCIAVFHWLTGLETPQATLWTGQIINILAVSGLYSLTRFVTKSRWAGLFSILLGGLLFSMPMYYINWGRYTQLAGQVILPALVVMIWMIMEDPKINRSSLILCGMAIGGLGLTHYRILILALPVIPAIWLINVKSQSPVHQAKKVFWMGLIGGMVFLPWFIHVFSGNLMRITGNQLSRISVNNADFVSATANLSGYLPEWSWYGMLLSALWGLIRNDRRIASFLVWFIFMMVITNPQWLHLTGAGAITNFTVMIAMYIPASLLIAAGLDWAMVWLDKKTYKNSSIKPWERNGLRIISSILVVCICIWGVRQRMHDLEIASHALGVRPDLRAARWIQDNLPADARVLVNSMSAYNGTAVVGTDGGWWLPLIAKRRTTQPPLNYVSEFGDHPNYRYWINQLVIEVTGKGIGDPTVLAMLRERKVTHVFIGQLQGRVNSDNELLELDQLLKSPDFRLIYHQDRVWIFEIDHQKS